MSRRKAWPDGPRYKEGYVLDYQGKEYLVISGKWAGGEDGLDPWPDGWLVTLMELVNGQPNYEKSSISFYQSSPYSSDEICPNPKILRIMKKVEEVSYENGRHVTTVYYENTTEPIPTESEKPPSRGGFRITCGTGSR